MRWWIPDRSRRSRPRELAFLFGTSPSRRWTLQKLGLFCTIGSRLRIGFVCTPGTPVERWRDRILTVPASRPARELALFRTKAQGQGAAVWVSGRCPLIPSPIGFVLPRPFPRVIHHNSFSIKHLSFVLLRWNWVCFARFGPAAPATLPACARCRPCGEIGFVSHNRSAAISYLKLQTSHFKLLVIYVPLPITCRVA